MCSSDLPLKMVLPEEGLIYIMLGSAIMKGAPHPNAARLAANFAVSRQAQAFSAAAGRIPVRADVTPTPPDALQRIAGRTLVSTAFGPEDDRKWKRTFDELFKRR